MTSTYVITGATGAIGGSTAAALVGADRRVILLSRDAERATAVADRLGGGEVAGVVVTDLSSLASVRHAVEEVTARVDGLSGLVHAASIFVRDRRVTPEGFELMFATNHLGPFLLTNLLLPLLRGEPRSRIVTVAAPSTSKVHLDDLQGERRFAALQAFGATKAENLLFTFALGRRLGAEIAANAIHPGLVRSGLTKEMPAIVRLPTRLLSRTPDRAGQAIARLVSGEIHSDATGRFFKLERETRPPKPTTDEALQEALWQASTRLSGLDQQMPDDRGTSRGA